MCVGPAAIANAIKDNGAMTSLDVSDNNLGALILPEGWECDKSASDWDSNKWIYKHTDGREQKGHPGKPEGIIALANVIPNMGAMTSLNLASNKLRAEGAKIVAEAIKVTKCTPAFILFGTIFMPI
jgi:hypothetical protein